MLTGPLLLRGTAEDEKQAAESPGTTTHNSSLTAHCCSDLYNKTHSVTRGNHKDVKISESFVLGEKSKSTLTSIHDEVTDQRVEDDTRRFENEDAPSPHAEVYKKKRGSQQTITHTRKSKRRENKPTTERPR